MLRDKISFIHLIIHVLILHDANEHTLWLPGGAGRVGGASGDTSGGRRLGCHRRAGRESRGVAESLRRAQAEPPRQRARTADIHRW